MKITVQQLDSVNVQLSIEVEPETVNRAFERAVRILGKTVRVPGFRPGQAPLKVLRQMFSDEQVRRVAGDILIEDTLPKALEQQNLQPYRAPQVQVEQLQEGEPFRYKATVPLRPQVELGDYQDLRFPIPPQETSEEEVQQALESLREQMMRLEKVTDRSPQAEDRLVIRMRSLETENAPAQRYMVVLGRTFGELDNTLATMQIDETKQVTLTFPESFDDPQFAGKTVPVEITLLQIHAPVYPEIDDSLAMMMGLETLEQLRDYVRQRITQEKYRVLQEQVRDQLLSALRERSTVHLPATLIEEQLQDEITEFASELQANNLTLETFLQQTGATKEQVIEDLRQRGITRLQNTFILLEIAQREGIHPTDQEVEQVLEVNVLPHARTPQERARLRTDRNLRERIRKEIAIEKALQILMERTQNTPEGVSA